MGSFPRPILAGLTSMALVTMIAGCGGSEGGNGGTDPVTTGTVRVTVTADGSSKSDVLVQLFAPSATSPTSAVRSNSSGVATFSSVEEGDWELEVTTPGGFGLADGEEERKSVTVVAGQTANSSFALVDNFEGTTIEATSSNTFSPSTVTISSGTSVRWVNVSMVLHTVTPDEHSEWSSASLNGNGTSFVHTFDTPGTYAYYCEPHVGQGMTGTITVN